MNWKSLVCRLEIIGQALGICMNYLIKKTSILN